MSKDFNFYGEEDEADEVNSEDIKGITDEVSQYIYSDMAYPCFCLKKDIKLPRHKWSIISKLVKQTTKDKNIAVYMIRGNEMFKVGSLAGVQVKAFISIVGIENMFGYFSRDVKLEGDRLYVLSA